MSDDGASAEAGPETEPAKKRRFDKKLKRLTLAVVFLVVGAVGVIAWQQVAPTLAARKYRTVVYRVPAAEDHFLSLAYHAVYQKGLKSGLPTRYSHLRSDGEPEHDYAGVLTQLAAATGSTVEIDMEGLSDHLTRSGWAPDDATIDKLAQHNPWVSAHYRTIRR